MARPCRITEADTIYHVMSRGVAGADTFLDDVDFRKFIAVLVETKERLHFSLFAYCLMPNHFHLLMQTHRVTISQIMQLALTRYAIYFNLRRGRQGHVFQARFKALACANQRYFSELVQYIHLNPVRAKIVSSPELWTWSSYRDYLGEKIGFVDKVSGLAPLSETTSTPAENCAGGHESGRQEKIASRADLEEIGRQAATKCCVSMEAMRSGNRSQSVWDARGYFVEKAVCAGWRPYEIARFLNCSQAAISKRLAKSVVKVVKA